MEKTGSRTAKILAALILLPLLIVAALVGVDLFGDRALQAEADSLSAALDRTLDRSGPDRRFGLAILPLTNAGDAPTLDYLADGVSAEIRDQLERFDGLTVIGGQSSKNIASQSLPIASVARVLGVNHVLHGTIDGDEYGLSLELELSHFDKDLSRVWRETWTGRADALPITTRAVATRVVQSVLPSASTGPGSASADPPAGALDDYLHGKYLIDRYNRDEVLGGIRFLERAIEADPGFERAVWAKIAAHQRMTWIDAQSATEHVALTEATIDAYLALNAESALTHRLHALRASNDNRPLEAFTAFQRAVQISPQQFAFDRGYMSDLCQSGYLNRCLEQAQGLARADPVSAAAHTGLATVYQLMGDHDRMLEHARLSKRFGGELAQYFEAQAQLRRGEFAQASQTLADALESVGVSGDWVEAFVAAGQDPAKAAAAVAAMQAVDAASAEWLDLFYSELTAIGELDLAFEVTQTLIAERYQTWNLYVWGPEMRPYRDDPRFVDAMQAMGLVEAWNELGLPDACSADPPELFCSRVGAVLADR